MHCEPSLPCCAAELKGTGSCSNIACHSHKNTEKLDGHQSERDTPDDRATLSGGLQANRYKASNPERQYQHGLSFRGGGNEKTARSKPVSSQAIKSNSSNSPPTIFLWKGQNYVVKMAHDLDFLDDENMVASVPAWLGFPVRSNPFLIPPEGHDICYLLQQGHEQRCKEIAVRRRQRQKQHHRFGGTSNGQKRFSRCRARGNSGANRQRLSGDGDLSASRSYRPSGQGQEIEPGFDYGNNIGGGAVSPEATNKSQHHRYKHAQLHTDSNATECDSKERAGSTTFNMTATIALPGGEGTDNTFVTAGGMATTGESLGSASTCAEPPFCTGHGDVEDEDIPCELSSGEEEEVQWNGGGYLGFPIIPDVPENIRSKASAAAEILHSEDVAEKELELSAQEILANAKRTQEILHQPDQEHSSRVEWLAERSFRTGLRGALVDRHVSATRLKSSAAVSCWRDEPLMRRVSSAPAGRVGVVHRNHSSSPGWTVGKSATSTEEGHGHDSAALGTSRGGVCVSVDGGAKNGDGERIQSSRESLTPARSNRLASGSRNSTSRRGSRLRRRVRVPVEVSEGSTAGVSATSLGEGSMAASSLQASSSSMSARARAREVAIRPTAMRRPFCRNGGKIVIADPGKVPEIRHKAATVIQVALLAVCARRSVRRLRDNRECAALLIGQTWRRSRVRLRMWNAKRLRRAEELRQVAQGRARNRAAHLLQTFFRDIKYRRRRVRCVLGTCYDSSKMYGWHSLGVQLSIPGQRRSRPPHLARITKRSCLALGLFAMIRKSKPQALFRIEVGRLGALLLPASLLPS